MTIQCDLNNGQKITVRQLTTADRQFFSEALELLNRTQGRDLFSPTYLDECLADEKCFVLIGLVANQLVSVGVAQIINNYDYYLKFDSNIAQKFKNKIIGSFSTLCVHEDYRGQGIGQKISQHRLAWLKNQKCDSIIGVSWVSGLAHTSDRVFERMGFRAIKKVDNFYVESSTEKPFFCPGCQKSPCICSAIMYQLDLN